MQSSVRSRNLKIGHNLMLVQVKRSEINRQNVGNKKLQKQANFLDIPLSSPLEACRDLKSNWMNRAVILVRSGFDRFRVRGGLTHFFSLCLQSPQISPLILWRCVNRFLINARNEINDQIAYRVSILGSRCSNFTSVRAPWPIAKTPILSLTCVYSLWGMDLRAVSCAFCRADLCLQEGVREIDAQNPCSVWSPRLNSLPTGLNRISWKQEISLELPIASTPYRLG
jgi:hypothetical protein